MVAVDELLRCKMHRPTKRRSSMSDGGPGRCRTAETKRGSTAAPAAESPWPRKPFPPRIHPRTLLSESTPAGAPLLDPPASESVFDTRSRELPTDPIFGPIFKGASAGAARDGSTAVDTRGCPPRTARPYGPSSLSPRLALPPRTGRSLSGPFACILPGEGDGVAGPHPAGPRWAPPQDGGRRLAYWPGQTRDVEAYVGSCLPEQQGGPRRPGRRRAPTRCRCTPATSQERSGRCSITRSTRRLTQQAISIALESLLHSYDSEGSPGPPASRTRRRTQRGSSSRRHSARGTGSPTRTCWLWTATPSSRS